jgi:flagellar hook assembly protein FlgD
LQIVPGPIKWQVKIKNNPGFDFDGKRTSVVLTPNAKGGKIPVSVHIRLFSNLGDIVAEEIITNDNVPAGLDENTIVWEWPGRNKKGRSVGTGTYLFRAVCTATREDGKGERYDVQRSIGFVKK